MSIPNISIDLPGMMAQIPKDQDIKTFVLSSQGKAFRESLQKAAHRVNNLVINDPATLLRQKKEDLARFFHDAHELAYVVNRINAVINQEEARISKSFFLRIWAKIFGTVQPVESVTSETIRKISALNILKQLSDTKSHAEELFQNADVFLKGVNIFSIVATDNPGKFLILQKGKKELEIDVGSTTGELQVGGMLFKSFDELRKVLELGQHVHHIADIEKLKTPATDINTLEQELQKYVRALGVNKTKGVFVIGESEQWFHAIRKFFGKVSTYTTILYVDDKGVVQRSKIELSTKGVTVEGRVFKNIEDMRDHLIKGTRLQPLDSLKLEYDNVFQNHQKLLDLQGKDVFNIKAPSEFEFIVDALRPTDISIEGAYLLQNKSENEVVFHIVKNKKVEPCPVLCTEKQNCFVYREKEYTYDALVKELGLKQKLGFNALARLKEQAGIYMNSGDFVYALKTSEDAGKKLMTLMRSCGQVLDGAWLIRSTEKEEAHRYSVTEPRYQYILSVLHREGEKFRLQEHPITLDPETGGVRCEDARAKSLNDFIQQLQAAKQLPFAPAVSQELVLRPQGLKWASVSDLEKAMKHVRKNKTIVERSDGFHKGVTIVDIAIRSWLSRILNIQKPSQWSFAKRDDATKTLQEMHKKYPNVEIFVVYPLGEKTESLSFDFQQQKYEAMMDKHIFNFSTLDGSGNVRHFLLDLSINPGQFTLTDLEGNPLQVVKDFSTLSETAQPFQKVWQNFQKGIKMEQQKVLRIKAPIPEAAEAATEQPAQKPVQEKPAPQPVAEQQPQPGKAKKGKAAVAPETRMPDGVPPDVIKAYEKDEAFKRVAGKYREAGGGVSKRVNKVRAKAFWRSVFDEDNETVLRTKINEFLADHKADAWLGKPGHSYMDNLLKFYIPFAQGFKEK